MKLENQECFDDISDYTVEVPVREHKTPEVIEAKENQIKNCTTHIHHILWTTDITDSSFEGERYIITILYQ